MAAAQITKQSMGDSLHALERQGDVERVSDPNDGRAKLARLTQRGLEAESAATRMIHEIGGEWGSRFGPADFSALRQILERLCSALERDSALGQP